MNFLGLGPGEVFLILLLALIVFGPGKMPEIGAGLGKAIREFRKATTQITEELNRELRVDVPPQEPRRSAEAAPEPRPAPRPVAEIGSPSTAAASRPEKPDGGGA
ncbi:MAG: twin-arginine translocase TatA/TatE family subunit [Armatimonadetes bacterium]|nr:twin-arginine translocase TatA/TatE family subunit [Armatimonadota bacterium]